MRHQGEGTPHSLQTPVGLKCISHWGDERFILSADESCFADFTLSTVWPVDYWRALLDQTFSSSEMWMRLHWFLINIRFFGRLIPILFCSYVLWLAVTFHFLLTFAPSALLPLPVLLPSQIFSPHLSPSSVPSVSPMRLPCSLCSFSFVACPNQIIRRTAAPDWHMYSSVPFTLSAWSSTSSTVVLGKLAEGCASTLEHTLSPGVELAPLNPGLYISVTVLAQLVRCSFLPCHRPFSPYPPTPLACSLSCSSSPTILLYVLKPHRRSLRTFWGAVLLFCSSCSGSCQVRSIKPQPSIPGCLCAAFGSQLLTLQSSVMWWQACSTK